PDAAGALRDVGVRRASVMHLQVIVAAAAKELRAAGPEIRQSGEELLGCCAGRLVKVDGRHAGSFSMVPVAPVTAHRQLASVYASAAPTLDVRRCAPAACFTASAAARITAATSLGRTTIATGWLAWPNFR